MNNIIALKKTTCSRRNRTNLKDNEKLLSCSEWINTLITLTRINDEDLTDEWYDNYLNALNVFVDKNSLTKYSCYFVASKTFLFPTLKQIIDILKEWESENV